MNSIPRLPPQEEEVLAVGSVELTHYQCLRLSFGSVFDPRPALIQIGMSQNVDNLRLEMSAALNSGHMRALEPRSAQNTTTTSYETFVTEEFVPLYEGKSAAA